MKAAENYFTLGSKSRADIRSSFGKAISYCFILLFLCFMFFASISINKFISGTLSISLEDTEKNGYEENFPTVVERFVKNGDTLSKILTNQNISAEDIYKIINSLKDNNITYIPKIGQKITFRYETTISENSQDDLTSQTLNISSIDIQIDKVHHIEITRPNNKDFVARDFFIPLLKKITKTTSTIVNNFMSTANTMGVSTNNILEIINAYSYQIDFQRQIKEGDSVTFVTEQFFTEDGKFSHSGQVIFASMNLSGKNYNIYKYSPSESEQGQYFSEDGSSVKRNLLKTPMNVARISSHFGNRKHPIQGYTKMHRGVDFSAPIGTPIYSAGDGVITEIGWRSGYGKFIQVKHSATLSTAYGHASRFAPNLKVGSRIKQGQTIAYVGTTGNSTGPHLHYEVRVNGKQVNPSSFKGSPGALLSGLSRTKFEKFKQDLIKTHNL